MIPQINAIMYLIYCIRMYLEYFEYEGSESEDIDTDIDEIFMSLIQVCTSIIPLIECYLNFEEITKDKMQAHKIINNLLGYR